MEISKVDFFIIQSKINSGKLPGGLFNKLGYFFSGYDSTLLSKEVNGLAMKFLREEVESEKFKKSYEIPEEYERVFRLYLKK